MSPWLDLSCALLAGGLWYASRGSLGGWPLLVGLAPVGWRLARREAPLPRTPYDGLLVLFMLTAGLGVWAAYDRPAAWAKFWLLVGATLLFYALARQPAAHQRALALGCTLFGALIALYFMATHDFTALPAKWEALNRVAALWSRWRPALHDLHPNVAGGLVALAAPWSAAVWLDGRATGRGGRQGWALTSALIMLTGLLFTTSRGAWLALGLGLLVWAGWFFNRRAVAHGARWPGRLWVGLGGAAVTTVALAVWLAPQRVAALADRLPGPTSADSRLELARSAWQLIQDAPFTGLGLAAFPGWYAHYIRIIPHFYLIHSHNTWLDVWLEQGALAAAVWLVLLGVALWRLLRRSSGPAWWRGALLASFVVLLAHGLVDDALYGSRAALLLWVLPGMTLVGGSDTAELWSASRAALLLAVGLLLAAAPHWRAAWATDLGALDMARVELARFPTGLWSDGSEATRLASAESAFQRALLLDPDNRTALHRLGLIAGLRRDWPAAESRLTRALALDAGHRGVRKSLGYVEAWLGEAEKSAELLASIPEATFELDIYAGWWPAQGYPELGPRALAVRALLDN